MNAEVEGRRVLEADGLQHVADQQRDPAGHAVAQLAACAPAAGAEQRQHRSADQKPHGQERHRVGLVDRVLHHQERRPEEEGRHDQGGVGLPPGDGRAGRESRAGRGTAASDTRRRRRLRAPGGPARAGRRARPAPPAGGSPTSTVCSPARRAPTRLPSASSRNTARSAGDAASCSERVGEDRRVRLAHARPTSCRPPRRTGRRPPPAPARRSTPRATLLVMSAVR